MTWRHGGVPEDFNSATEVLEDVLLIKYSGEIDLYRKPEIVKCLKEEVEEKYWSLIIDLKEVSFLDATLPGLLVGFQNKMSKFPLWKGIAIVCPDNRVRRIFELTGLDLVFRLCLTREEALGSFH